MGRSSIKWRLLPAVSIVFSFFGRSWVDFYQWMLNRQERNNSISKIIAANRGATGKDRGLYDLTRSEYHLAYMKRHGLQRDKRVLDFGCGFGRSAVPLIKFLNPGMYRGVEISDERLRIAREWLVREGLSDVPHEFIHSKNCDLGYLIDESIDFFWAQAVISHMPERDIRKVLVALHRVMAPSGVVLFDYVEAEENFVRHTVKDFFYTRSQMESFVTSSGWSFKRLTDWNDDLPEVERNPAAIVLKLTK
ncbi:class I SAM-dependent methyltransferase [Thalassospira xiamenensis]|uniref:class I SAM-dependent methyltransferase n=1 Tax=Thalassospira xiamenensis TaxID=220697 RepID=UPI0015EFE304|nr:class I SAM-dependent methyltransferase [Thalassospira xiamenensis]